MLVPFLLDEILPGDHMQYRVTAYVRMSTPLFPIFDNQRVDTFFFFVPMRLLWSNWAKFMGEQEPPNTSYQGELIPVIDPADTTGGFTVGSVADHFGLPTSDTVDPAGTFDFISALPFRAYNLIWNQWFRDQNSQASRQVNVDNGPDSLSDYSILFRNKSHDYFTSALPWPQKFNAPVVPLSGFAPIQGFGAITPGAAASVDQTVTETARGTVVYPFSVTNAQSTYRMEVASAAPWIPAIYADLGDTLGGAGTTPNLIRQAFLIQQLLERDARGGTRYVELIRSHFGVISPDFRLQRPEYIGGGQTPLIITPIAQTAPADDSVVGALGATGTAAGAHTASYASTEHGYIIGFINVRSELSYQQGIHKMWTRQSRFDFYFPALAQLGEQAVLMQELYATGIEDEDNDFSVFGYQERWQEYRTRYSEVTGMFKSGITGTLDAWHLAQEFATPPQLGTDFIRDNPPMERVLAAAELAGNQEYLADIMISRTAVRPIPTFGTPAMLGRF